jgi:NADH dehydrogenase
VGPNGVRLKDGHRLPTQTLIWAAGVKASPVANLLGVEQTRDDRVVVNDDLSIPTHPNVFVVGDMAAIREDGAAEGEETYLPQLAQVAIQSGRHAADQIGALRAERSTEAFHYTDLGQMATIGRNAAVAELAGGIKFKGLIAWVLWVFIHIAKLVGFRNRLNAFVNWAYNYFTYSRSARLILDVVPIDDETPLEVEEVDAEVKKRLQEVAAERQA